MNPGPSHHRRLPAAAAARRSPPTHAATTIEHDERRDILPLPCGARAHVHLAIDPSEFVRGNAPGQPVATPDGLYGLAATAIGRLNL